MKRIRGFTLLEVLVALTIVSILITVGSVNFRNYRLLTLGEAFVSDLEHLLKETRTYALEGHCRLSLLLDQKVVYLISPEKQEVALKIPAGGQLSFKNKWGYNQEIIFLPNGKLLHTRGSLYFNWSKFKWRLICLENGSIRIERDHNEQ